MGEGEAGAAAEQEREAPAAEPLPTAGADEKSLIVELNERVNEYTQHEQRQVETQQKLILDLMRCVAENHEYIAQQQAQLQANTAEIDQLKQLLGGAGAAGGFSLAQLPTQLTTIEDELAALRALAERTPPAMDDELRAIKQKFKLMEQQQAKHTEDLGKAWGYIMADEAAEDVANSAGVDGEWSDQDERYAMMTQKALAIASNQTTTKLKQAFGIDNGIPIDSAFWRWASWADDMKQEREEREKQEAAEKKAREEAEEAARMAAADEEEKKRLLLAKEEAKRDAEQLAAAKESGEEWGAVREAEDAVALAKQRLANCTTEEERVLARAALASAQEKLDKETKKAEAAWELKKAERALAKASTPEEKAAAEAALAAARTTQELAAAAVDELAASQAAMRTTLKAKIKLMGKLSAAKAKKAKKGEEAARHAKEREEKAAQMAKKVKDDQGEGSVEQEKMEEKVSRKLDQKRREANLMKNVDYLMALVPEMQRQFADEQVVQDDAILDSSKQLQKLQAESDKLQAELKACMSMATATAEGMKKLQSSVDRLDADKTGSVVPPDFADRFAKMESLLDAFSGLGELRAQIDDHTARLAEMFTRKASKDELDAMKNSLKGMGDSFATQLAKAAGEIVAELNETKAGMEGQLSGLFAQMGGKVDTLWVDDLERQLRNEIERLSRLGKNTIDMAALDAKLAALRAALEAELHKNEDEASGSAAFRCLLCDRPLPPKEDWRLRQRSELSASIPHSHEEVERGYGGSSAAAARKGSGEGGAAGSFGGYESEPCVVYRAGFPTVGRPTSKGGVGVGALHTQDLSVSTMASGQFAPMASSWGQRGMADSRSGRNLPPVPLRNIVMHAVICAA